VGGTTSEKNNAMVVQSPTDWLVGLLIDLVIDQMGHKLNGS